jgi:hypothetical protein
MHRKLILQRHPHILVELIEISKLLGWMYDWGSNSGLSILYVKSLLLLLDIDMYDLGTLLDFLMLFIIAPHITRGSKE